MKDDRNIAELMKRAAKKLDEVETPTPDFAYFKELAEREMAAVRRSQLRQFALFVAVALALVAGLLFCLGSFQTVFFVLQGVAVAGAVAGLAVFFTRSARPKEGTR